METLKVGELKSKYIFDSPRPLGILKGKAKCIIGDDFKISDKELLVS